jgi:hypothetical protein
MYNLKNVLLFALVAGLSIGLMSSPSKTAENNNCLELEEAEKIKKLIDEKGYFLDFCSSCSPSKAAIRRININQTELIEKSCGWTVKAKGQIVRGIKPPVFGGECTERLTVSSPGTRLEIPYETEVKVSNTYINTGGKSFVSLAKIAEIKSSKACIQEIRF